MAGLIRNRLDSIGSLELGFAVALPNLRTDNQPCLVLLFNQFLVKMALLYIDLDNINCYLYPQKAEKSYNDVAIPYPERQGF